MSNVQYQHADYEEALGRRPATATATWRVAPPPPFARAGEKVGRNDPCPCGSGKKYKHCHGSSADRFVAPRGGGPAFAKSPRHARPLHAADRGIAAAGPGRRARRRGREDQELGPRRRAARRRASRARSRRACSRRTASAPRRSPCAATISRASTSRRSLRALVVNAGNANAGTGEPGLADARADVRRGRAAARLRARGSAAVFDRRDHGAAAGRAIVDALPAARRPRARRRLVRRRDARS